MSACKCSERKRPLLLPIGSNDRPRQWVVWSRNYSQSAFNGYRRQWSDYSTVFCPVCRSMWRTKMDVSDIPDSKFFPQSQDPKVPSYEEYMASET